MASLNPYYALLSLIVQGMTSLPGAPLHATGAWSCEVIDKVTECVPLGDKKARIVSSDIPSVDAWN